VNPRILIIDDDAAVCSSLASVLATHGFEATSFTAARTAIEQLPDIGCDCVVLDVRMPDLDGLTALKLIQSAGAHPPVIMITGHADVPMAVQAMKLGAADFIEKPVDDEELVRSIRTAIERSKRDAEEVSLARVVRERYATLTPREQSVADLVVDGYSSSAIAANLNISVRTVDHHRASILAKMQATSLPQLLKFLLFIPRDRRDAPENPK
jgi:two-component system, LuxR family, response regulator FixJ